MRDSRSVKKTQSLGVGLFKIYAPRRLRFPNSTYTDYDTEIIITIPHHCEAYYCSKCRGKK